ncbi:DNA-binding protein [Streptomyces fumigatiscleroticus]|nr:DNA-binding protein [Streptomyces fumigatiscleroticus]
MWRVRRSETRPHQTVVPTPPFDAFAARRLRAALEMEPEHVAHGMRVSYGLPYVSPDLVTAWEGGAVNPTGRELRALAGVLWCSPDELTGRPRTLREHRLAQGLAPEHVARGAGLELPAYLRMEATGSWRGNARQSALLADVLGLSLPDFVTVTGREGPLTDLLHKAVTGRWQTCVRPVSKLVPLERHRLQEALRQLHEEYREHEVTVIGRSGGTQETAEDGQEFLARIIDHFWTRLGVTP